MLAGCHWYSYSISADCATGHNGSSGWALGHPQRVMQLSGTGRSRHSTSIRWIPRGRDDALDRSEAWRIFDQLWADERVLWAEEPAELDAVLRAISARDDKSHKLWTDDYLAAFAQTSGATLATLDRQLASRYPSVRVESLLPA